jgi:nitroimidazol reductase NimA-like FMN-containing flavoprotein (pyridoxamine 5'-phosphate oxidase superfamily)
MVSTLTNEEIEVVLTRNALGRLGCNDGFNSYVFPVNYLYDGKYILCQSLSGFKIQVMRQNKRVCLLVDEVADFTNWKSVMVLGEYQELNDKRARYVVIKAFIKRMLHIKVTDTALFTQLNKTKNTYSNSDSCRPIIYRIMIDEKTGKYEIA